jgi:hypothetical protein
MTLAASLRLTRLGVSSQEIGGGVETRMQGERSVSMEILLIGCNPISGDVALCR